MMRILLSRRMNFCDEFISEQSIAREALLSNLTIETGFV